MNSSLKDNFLTFCLFDFKICFLLLSGFPTPSPILCTFPFPLAPSSPFILHLSVLNEALTILLLFKLLSLFISFLPLSVRENDLLYKGLHSVDQFCLKELSTMMKMFSSCALPIGSNWPHMPIEHLKCCLYD